MFLLYRVSYMMKPTLLFQITDSYVSPGPLPCPVSRTGPRAPLIPPPFFFASSDLATASSAAQLQKHPVLAGSVQQVVVICKKDGLGKEKKTHLKAQEIKKKKNGLLKHNEGQTHTELVATALEVTWCWCPDSRPVYLGGVWDWSSSVELGTPMPPLGDSSSFSPSEFPLLLKTSFARQGLNHTCA